MINEKGSVGVLGSVGEDIYGELYEKLLREEDIVPIFQRFKEVNTGICAVFCCFKDRGHITDLGASILISEGFIESVWDSLKQVELIYTELFILKHRRGIVFSLAELGICDKKIFGFNLPSFYFIDTYLEDIRHLFEYADIVFTNAAEAKLFGNLLGIMDTNNLSDLCEALAKLNKKNVTKKRVVVITCGPDPVYVTEYDHYKKNITYKAKHYPENVDDDCIIDTNGAGDAFAGGFLSRYIKGQSLDDCAKAGHWAAALIIQTRGCQLPKKCDYSNDDNLIIYK
jgi:adenosine kinase